MPMPGPLSLASMAASMSDEDINLRKDYREEKIAALEKLTFDELREVEIPIPRNYNSHDQFNLSIRVLMMKRHGLFEDRMDEFKDAVRLSLAQSGSKLTEAIGDDEDEPTMVEMNPETDDEDGIDMFDGSEEE